MKKVFAIIKKHIVQEISQRIDELYRLMSEKHEMIVADRQRIEDLYELVSEKHEMIVADRQRIEGLYELASKKHEMIVADRQRIEDLYGLVSEKHEMIVADRQRIEDLYELVSEKHEMIVADRQRIEDLYELVSEKHEMIVADRQKIEDLYGLVSEKHEMIMSAKQDITSLTKYAILSYWQEKEQTDEQRIVIEWIKENGIAMYPYAWTEEYVGRTVNVLADDENWHFVYHNEKKLYFPQSFGEEEIKKYYTFLIMEQDERSPHCYFTKEDDAGKKNLVWYDVGAAEGIITLDHIEEIKRGYLVECEQPWVEALRKTFEPYKDKIIIIAKTADCYTDEKHIALKELIDPTETCLIKIDVEGHEKEVLEGIDWRNVKIESRIIVCAYHHQEDEKILGQYLTENMVEYDMSSGYILSNWGGHKEPYLRRGLFRGIKK